jgi:hypothetical protein
MPTLSKDRQWQFGAFFASVLLLVLMQGCIKVNVSTTCPPGARGGSGSGGEIEDPPGACKKELAPPPYNTDANTFYAAPIALYGTVVGPGKQCIAGSKCKAAAGFCALGDTIPCKTWYWPTANPNTGNCTCDCPNAH